MGSCQVGRSLPQNRAFQRVKIIILKENNGDLSSWTVLSPSVGLLFFQEMQEDQQKQLKDMKENIGYYQKKAKELEVRYNAIFFFTRLKISLATFVVETADQEIYNLFFNLLQIQSKLFFFSWKALVR